MHAAVPYWWSMLCYTGKNDRRVRSSPIRWKHQNRFDDGHESKNINRNKCGFLSIYNESLCPWNRHTCKALLNMSSSSPLHQLILAEQLWSAQCRNGLWTIITLLILCTRSVANYTALSAYSTFTQFFSLLLSNILKFQCSSMVHRLFSDTVHGNKYILAQAHHFHDHILSRQPIRIHTVKCATISRACAWSCIQPLVCKYLSIHTGFADNDCELFNCSCQSISIASTVFGAFYNVSMLGELKLIISIISTKNWHRKSPFLSQSLRFIQLQEATYFVLPYNHSLACCTGDHGKYDWLCSVNWTI